MKNRQVKERLLRRASGKLGRLLVLTGARQTGKTTLATRAFSDWAYISLEDPVARPSYTRLSAAEWIARHPRAVLDEVQKAPSLVESIKAAYDASPDVRYVLLGSSQILLLRRVRESLAGRVAIEELWPLTLPEMASTSWDEPLAPSRLVRWLGGERDDEALLGSPLTSAAYARYAEVLERYLSFGGMPVVHDPDLTDEERSAWLRDYHRTYLERDVADLAALADLEPFLLAQRALAARTGQTVNFSALARTASIAPATARRFLRYLELSYQVLKLPPYFRNPNKRLSKMPKVHFVDPGVLRAVANRTGALTGHEFESAVVAEILKQLRNAGLRAELFHLRTHGGREVDLLLELPGGFVAIEIKQTARISDTDARSLRGLERFLDRPLLGLFVLSQDPDARRLAGGVLALPVAWALSPAGE